MSQSGDSSGEGSSARRSGWESVMVFLMFISLPLLLWIFDRVDGYKAEWQGDSLREKLSSFENGFASLPVFEYLRDIDQQFLTEELGAGNARVVVGDNGWLHYRADLDAVIGKGPFYEEPDSVSRAPGLKPWNRPGPVIQHFVRQLEEREIELVLVPVPTKAMAVSIDGASRAMAPGYYDELLDELEKVGVEVIDLMPVLSQPDSFLKHDTHWTPAAMERSAQRVAEHLGGTEEPSVARNAVDEEMSGDLVSMLFGDESSPLYPKEPVRLTRVTEPVETDFVLSDPDASWVLLGDSFVNVFDDPTLGFPNRKEQGRLGAGFASHLAAELGRPLHVIAMNGSGATGVRKAFAALPDDVVREKKKLIWVLSARDLLLAETPGRRAGIEWARVEFSQHREGLDSADGVVLEATLKARSEFRDPETTPYDSAVYSVHFGSVEVIQGDYPAKEAHVFLWAFRDKQMEETGRLQVGKRYRLSAMPLPDEGPVAQTTRLDDFFFPDLPRLFADSVEELE